MTSPSSAVDLLHLRRLDRFFRHHGLRSTAHTLETESLAFFDAAHLQKLVTRGRWEAAGRYMTRFSPLFSGEEEEGPSRHYTAFMHAIDHCAMLDYLACRGDDGRAARSTFPAPSDDAFRRKCPELARKKDLYHSMASAQARESLNWDHMKLEILEKLRELLRQHPDIQCSSRMRLPQRTPTLPEIVPLGLRGPQRYCQRKRIDHKPARELAQFLIRKRLRSVETKNHSNESGVLSAKVLQPSLASEARTAQSCTWVAVTGVKRTRYQDDYSSGDAHQVLDSSEGSKNSQIVESFWQAPETDVTVSEMLGANGSIGYEAEVGSSKFKLKKLKMSAMPVLQN